MASIDCRFDSRDFAPGRAGASPAPRGVGARGWRRICSPDLFLSPTPPAPPSVPAGFVFFRNRILGSASELILGVTTRRCHGTFFAPGLSLWIFSWDTLFRLHRTVSYPGLALWPLTPPGSNVTNTVENIVRMPPG